MRAAAFAVFACCALACSGCLQQAKSPVDAERAAVAMAAEAVKQVDDACAKVGLEKHDVGLLTACKDGYNIARPALVAAQYYVQIGDQAGLEAELCTGEKALASTAKAVQAAGGTLPPIVPEALRFAGSLCGGNNA